MTNGLTHNEDASLQRWGANLKGAEDAAAEVAAKYQQAEDAAEAFRSTWGKVANQGENELPVSNRVKADVDSITTRAKKAATAAEWRSVGADAATLPAAYQREHETDEDRLNAPRGSRARERRADVSVAEQDT